MPDVSANKSRLVTMVIHGELLTIAIIQLCAAIGRLYFCRAQPSLIDNTGDGA